MVQKETGVVHVVCFLSDANRHAFHCKKILRFRGHHAQMRHLPVVSKAASRAEESLHRVVKPVRRDIEPGMDGYGLCSLADFGGRTEQGIHVSCGCPGIERQAHDGAAHDIDFTSHAGARQFLIQLPEEDVNLPCRKGHAQTRVPTEESMKMLRRRNGAGEFVRRCRRRFFRSVPNQGSLNGATSAVQDGGRTPFRPAAYSTMPQR